MKTKLLILTVAVITLLSAACGPAAETGEPSAPIESENPGALDVVTQPAPQETAVPTTPQPAAPEAYPAQPTAVPLPEGYPDPAAPIATFDPYPGAVDGFIWMLLPVGIQCEDDSSLYTDLQDAVAGLTAVNIRTGQSEMAELMVCSACNCPTSEHYRVQIAIEDVNAAQTLGWTREP